MAKIYNKKTGEVIDVQDTQLQSYGIPTSQPQNNTPSMDESTTMSSQPKSTITGHTLQEIQEYKRRAQMAGDTNAVKQFDIDYTREYQYQKDTGNIGKKEKDTQKMKDVKVFKNEVISLATQLQDIIANKNNYSPENYNSLIDSYTSALTTKQKEASNFGASLTANELAILAGQIPVRREIGQSVSSFFNQYINPWTQGQKPVQTGRVVDDDKTMARKMKILIPQLKGEKITPDVMQADKLKADGVEGFIGNVGKNAYDIGNSLLNMPAAALKALQEDPVNALSEISPTKLPLTLGKGLIDQANEALGRPLEGGDILSRIGQHAYEKPVDTALLVAPFLPKIKLPKIKPEGKVSSAQEAIKTETAGRLATQVAAPDLNSVIKSEKLMKDALQTTNSVTRRGMARQLEQNTAKIGKNIDKYAKNLDKSIGGQPVDDVLITVDQSLSTRSPVQGYPELYKTVRGMVEKDIKAGFLPDGQPAATMETLNNARINLNRSISSNWFKNGMPLSSHGDVLNAIKWDYSNQLKNLMGEADKTGYFKRAINLQHVSIQTAPVLAEKALASQGSFGLYGMAREAIDKIFTVPQVTSARRAQGTIDPLTKQIMSGELPVTAEGSATLLPEPPRIQNKAAFQAIQESINPKPINTQTIKNPTGKKLVDENVKKVETGIGSYSSLKNPQKLKEVVAATRKSKNGFDAIAYNTKDKTETIIGTYPNEKAAMQIAQKSVSEGSGKKISKKNNNFTSAKQAIDESINPKPAVGDGVGEMGYRSPHQILGDTKSVNNLTDLENIVKQHKVNNGYLTKYDLSDLRKLRELQGKPNAEVRIYRASPVNELNSGDWVTTSKTYANDIKKQNGGKVYEYTVKASDLKYPNDITELPSLARFSAFKYEPVKPPPPAVNAGVGELEHARGTKAASELGGLNVVGAKNLKAAEKTLQKAGEMPMEIKTTKTTKDFIKNYYETKKSPVIGDTFVNAKGERVEITKITDNGIEYFLKGQKKGIYGTVYLDKPPPPAVKPK